MEVIIKDIIGTSCITAEDGDKIYQIIYTICLKNTNILDIFYLLKSSF